MAFVTNPKPEPHKRVKGRKDRQEARIKQSVREQTVERDGYCLIATRIAHATARLLGPCEGPSEWAHIGRHRRCFTRGQAPETRHTTAGSGQLCQKHHRAYDAHAFDIRTYEPNGMDGSLAVVRRAA